MKTIVGSGSDRSQQNASLESEHAAANQIRRTHRTESTASTLVSLGGGAEAAAGGGCCSHAKRDVSASDGAASRQRVGGESPVHAAFESHIPGFDECLREAYSSASTMATDGSATFGPPTTVQVHACGRVLRISASCGRLQDLQDFLHNEFGMVDQTFEVYDSECRRLLMDCEIRESIAAGRTPLSATLSDAAVHLIENRREELAQMQWKVMRDQNSQASGKFALLTAEVRDIKARAENLKQELHSAFDRLRADLLSKFDVAESQARNDRRHADEAVASIKQLAHTERGLRESAVEQIGTVLQGLRESIDDSRSTMRNMAVSAETRADEAGKLAERSRRAHEELDERVKKDLQILSVKLEDLATSALDGLQECRRQAEGAARSTREAIEAEARRCCKVRSDIEQTAEVVAFRIGVVENRCLALECQVADGQQRHSEALDRLVLRQEKVSGSLEKVGLAVDQREQGFHSMQARVEELEAAVVSIQAAAHRSRDEERSARELDITMLREAMRVGEEVLKADVCSQMSCFRDLEAGQREHSVSQVRSLVKDAMRSFRDQTLQDIKNAQSCQDSRSAAAHPPGCFGGIGEITGESVRVDAQQLPGQQNATVRSCSPRGRQSVVRRREESPYYLAGVGAGKVVPTSSAAYAAPLVRGALEDSNLTLRQRQLECEQECERVRETHREKERTRSHDPARCRSTSWEPEHEIQQHDVAGYGDLVGGDTLSNTGACASLPCRASLADEDAAHARAGARNASLGPRRDFVIGSGSGGSGSGAYPNSISSFQSVPEGPVITTCASPLRKALPPWVSGLADAALQGVGARATTGDATL